MKIPIKNIYYLLCYAWNRLEARANIDVGALSGNRVENLLAKVLNEGVAHLLKTGLDRGYLDCQETTRSLRGKILFPETVSRLLLQQGRVACEIDDLSADVAHNRVIKAAMTTLISCSGLDRKIRSDLQSHIRRFGDVSDIDLSPSAFRRLQFHRNLTRYAFLINVCQLVALSFMPDERTGQRRFRASTENEQVMGLLFESFVRNFLRREQQAFQVSAAKIPWDLTFPAADSEWLPEMRTDITLTTPVQRIVVETKFSARPIQERFGKRTLRSSHLYQLLAYLGNLGATPGPLPKGVLLYAGPGVGTDLRYRVGGYDIEVRSLDLNHEWQNIHSNLLQLAKELRDNLAPAV